MGTTAWHQYMFSSSKVAPCPISPSDHAKWGIFDAKQDIKYNSSFKVRTFAIHVKQKNVPSFLFCISAYAPERESLRVCLIIDENINVLINFFHIFVQKNPILVVQKFLRILDIFLFLNRIASQEHRGRCRLFSYESPMYVGVNFRKRKLESFFDTKPYICRAYI